MSKPRIGFVGVGLMGHGIAKNLLARGHPLAVLLHRNRAAADDLFAAVPTRASRRAALAGPALHLIPSGARAPHVAGAGPRMPESRHVDGARRLGERPAHRPHAREEGGDQDEGDETRDPAHDLQGTGHGPIVPGRAVWLCGHALRRLRS